MKCPHCKDKDLVMSERKDVEIDYCPDCRGIWLDRGELDKILEKSREDEAPRVQAQASPQPQHHPQQPYMPHPSQHGGHHDPRYYKKRRKSFFEELFD